MSPAWGWLLAAAEEIEDIRPPIASDPAWMAVAVLTGLLLVVLVAYLLWPRPKVRHPVEPDPRAWALGRLQALAQRLPEMTAYGVSIEASDTLREYVSRRHGVRAPRQTTPEFLTSTLTHPSFTPPLRAHLAAFLETCDRIKYARVDPGREAGDSLLGQARAFIDGVS